MCFQISFKTYKEALRFQKTPKIAKKDIVVKKVLEESWSDENVFYSPWQNMRYEKGMHYTEKELDISISKDDSEFHSKHSKPFIVEINDGLHCYKDTWARKRCWGTLVYNTCQVDMVIPKGTKYYENEDGEIVTTDLIFY